QLEYIWGESEKPYTKYCSGEREISKSSLKAIAKTLNGNPNGIIVCGKQTDSKLASAIVHLAEALHVPVLADPLSQLRTGDHSKSHVIATYDALFRDKKVRKTLKPDYVLRFGAMPISKSYRFFIEENEDA